MFSSILIANRGEIAVRVAQACREMGVRSVAIYSTADENALHVQRANAAVCIGPPPALESYLNIPAILEAARTAEAEAVHPGYGFLAENATFAREVERAGLAWIGPPPEVIALMGDKIASKRLALNSGLPIIPGYEAEDQSLDRLATEAEAIGYPLMIKAAAGGGGRGMRAVWRRDDLRPAVESARREAHSAFGDDRIFLEKLLLHSRHIEIQLLADRHDNVIYLGERDCSVQRRNQKVIEESPSPALSAALRTAMGAHAVQLARACGYVGAGTVEFLFVGDRYYFLEMNTRIQVEHPVTEMVTGLDLVRLQIDIAAGHRLPLSQLVVQTRGHAVEARLYAEDPDNGFLPATGILETFRPPLGAGIRNDVGVSQGAEIGPHYDPLLAKLVVHAENRAQALARLRSALQDYHVLGVTTNLGFLSWVADHPTFHNGRADTDFVAREWQAQEPMPLPPEVAIAAAGFELLGSDARSAARPPLAPDPYNPWLQGAGWRSSGIPRNFVYQYGAHRYPVQALRIETGAWQITVEGSVRSVWLSLDRNGNVQIREGSSITQCSVVHRDAGVEVAWQGHVYHLSRPSDAAHASLLVDPRAQSAGLSAPMPSTVAKVAIQVGERVSAGQTLMVLEAMKMEHLIQAPHDGVVREVLFGEGDLVPAGAPVARMEAS